MKQGMGASGTWPEAPTPSLAGIPLAPTRHSGCCGVRWGRISSFLYGSQVQMLADPNAEAWLDGPLHPSCPVPRLESVAIPQALRSGSSQSGENEPAIVTRQPGEAVDGMGSCLWSLTVPQFLLAHLVPIFQLAS